MRRLEGRGNSWTIPMAQQAKLLRAGELKWETAQSIHVIPARCTYRLEKQTLNLLSSTNYHFLMEFRLHLLCVFGCFGSRLIGYRYLHSGFFEVRRGRTFALKLHIKTDIPNERTRAPQVEWECADVFVTLFNRLRYFVRKWKPKRYFRVLYTKISKSCKKKAESQFFGGYYKN